MGSLFLNVMCLLIILMVMGFFQSHTRHIPLPPLGFSLQPYEAHSSCDVHVNLVPFGFCILTCCFLQSNFFSFGLTMSLPPSCSCTLPLRLCLLILANTQIKQISDANIFFYFFFQKNKKFCVNYNEYIWFSC